ncbi:MAG: hypothetical protein QM831_27340 [Kofleriaceae bacterium]
MRTRRFQFGAELVEQMFRDQIPGIESPILNGFGSGYGFAVKRPNADSPLRPGAARWGGAYGHSWFISGDVVSVLLTGTSFDGMTGQLRNDVERMISTL